MNQSTNQTWVGKATLLSISSPNSFPRDQYQAVVQETAQAIILFLKEFILDMILDVEVELTLRQGHHDDRLARGINEDGFIRPDFGKEFVGYYFKDLVVHLKIGQETDEETKTFITHYVEGLTMTYFLENPSDFSNWEFNYRNHQKCAQPSIYRSADAFKVNFPSLDIDIV
jgi:hypothetical protein